MVLQVKYVQVEYMKKQKKEDEEYEKFLKEIRRLLSDKKLFIDTQRTYIHKLKNTGLI